MARSKNLMRIFIENNKKKSSKLHEKICVEYIFTQIAIKFQNHKETPSC